MAVEPVHAESVTKQITRARTLNRAHCDAEKNCCPANADMGNADDEADRLSAIHLCHGMSASTRLVNCSGGNLHLSFE